MTKWHKKGAAAARTGRYRDMYSAWKAAKGKPKLTARDKRIGVTFNGKMVEAQEYFYEGFLSVPKQNPRRKALPIGKLVTVKARRLKNGRVEIYRA